MRLSLALALCFAFASPLAAQQSVQVPATMASVPIAAGTLVATKIVAGISGKSIYVTGLLMAPVATSVVTFTSGTGSACGTNTAAVAGVMTFPAEQTVSFGTGNGAIMVVPQGADLCLTIGTAGAPGILTYAQY